MIAPFAQARDRLDTITGVGKRAAECIIAEIGVDMSRFPTAGAPGVLGRGAARATTSPAANAARARPTKGDVWLADILTQCAWAAARTRDTYLSAQFWRLARRIGKKKAAVAVGHSILVIAGTCSPTTATTTTSAATTSPDATPTASDNGPIGQLQALGYRVTLEPRRRLTPRGFTFQDEVNSAPAAADTAGPSWPRHERPIHSSWPVLWGHHAERRCPALGTRLVHC